MGVPLSDFESALNFAQFWQQYEGVTGITSAGQAIIVLTDCNPAAITAPIPSSFRGYPVTFFQIGGTTKLPV